MTSGSESDNLVGGTDNRGFVKETRSNRSTTNTTERGRRLREEPQSCSDCGTELDPDETESVCSDCESEVVDKTICDECGGEYITDGQETFCEECGAIASPHPRLESNTDHRDSSDMQRTGPVRSETSKTRGEGTVVSVSYTDGKGNTLSDTQHQRANRLRKVHCRAIYQDGQKARNEFAMNELSRITNVLNLPRTVRETGAVLYRRAFEENVIQGRSIEGIVGASTYYAARMDNTPRKLSEIARVSRVEQRRISNACKALSEGLNLSIDPADPMEYLSRYASQLDVERQVEQSARQLLEEADSSDVLSGRSAASVAASAIYAASVKRPGVTENLTQEDISDVTDVSTSSISNAYRALID